MAMSKCKECGKSISTLAKTCPGCGAPSPTKKTSSKEKKSKTKTPIQIIAIVVMLGLLSIPVYNWGNFGLNKAKSIKSEKVDSFNNTIDRVMFTCEGRARESETNLDKSFIDEYTLLKKNGEYDLRLSTNAYYGRPGTIFEANAGDLRISKLGIKMDVNIFPGLDQNAEFKMKRYSGTISLNTGSYSATSLYDYNNSPVSIHFEGKCIGIDKVVKYIK